MFGSKKPFVPPADASPAFLELVSGYGEEHVKELFAWGGRHGGDPPDDMLNVPSERYLGAMPVQRKWGTSTHEYTGYGNLFLTNQRLLWRSSGGNIEIPLGELTTSGVHAEYGRRWTRLMISVGPNQYEFGFYDWKPPAFPEFNRPSSRRFEGR